MKPRWKWSGLRSWGRVPPKLQFCYLPHAALPQKCAVAFKAHRGPTADSFNHRRPLLHRSTKKGKKNFRYCQRSFIEGVLHMAGEHGWTPTLMDWYRHELLMTTAAFTCVNGSESFYFFKSLARNSRQNANVSYLCRVGHLMRRPYWPHLLEPIVKYMLQKIRKVISTKQKMNTEWII